jgi:hypothetical protein
LNFLGDCRLPSSHFLLSPAEKLYNSGIPAFASP